MNTNAVADTILDYLTGKHERSYRNKAPQTPVPPYIVFRLDNTTDTYPSDDMYLNIDVYDVSTASVRAIEDLADLIDNDLNHKVMNTETMNLQSEREQRQYIPPEELVSLHLINLRYVVRAYFM